MPFTDNIYIKARLILNATSNGGRKTGIKSRYRPNHVFEYKDNGQFERTFIGEIQFDHKEIILPGESADVTICFLDIPEIHPYLKVGQKWFIHEGNMLSGQAEITKI